MKIRLSNRSFQDDDVCIINHVPQRSNLWFKLQEKGKKHTTTQTCVLCECLPQRCDKGFCDLVTGSSPSSISESNLWLSAPNINLSFSEFHSCSCQSMDIMTSAWLNESSCPAVILNHFNYTQRSVNINKARACPTPSHVYEHALQCC